MSTDTSAGSPDRFGYERGRYSSIKPEYEEQFRRWLPFYSPADWAGGMPRALLKKEGGVARP